MEEVVGIFGSRRKMCGGGGWMGGWGKELWGEEGRVVVGRV